LKEPCLRFFFLSLLIRFFKPDENAYPHDMRAAKRFVEFYACGVKEKKNDKSKTHSIDGF